MANALKQRLMDNWERLSPRARQWGTVAAISGTIVVILWAAFSLGSDGKKPTASTTPRSELRPTNIDLMAPGSQVKDVETWVGKAGRELELYKQDRDEQRRVNREQQESKAEMMRRLTELETRLKAAQAEPPKAGASAPVAPATPTPPPSPARFPPDNALAGRGLPPPPPDPTGRGAMPPGTPAFGELSPAQPQPQPQLLRVAVGAPSKTAAEGGDAKSQAKAVDTFLPVSFTRGVLLGGVDAPTGGQSQSNPHPIVIMLKDNSVLPNRFRGEYRECFVIAAAYGDISSERAYGRTESLSCVSKDGRALEVKIQGSIFGEDGKVGMRGRLVTKQGQMLANALMAGAVSGIGQGISTANTTYSTSALGTMATSTGSDAMKAGVGGGVGKALDRLAQYYIKLAEQTFPIIEIDAGREVDVVLTKGVRIEYSGETAKASPTSDTRTATNDRFQKVNDDEE
ncbi:TraB/VirB10 family protein [Rhizobacter sp. Root1221]|uniref:TraB/VirB10 family protein n=1 Tax=Rhizobacter sp. Root1221 TaxID=1736433 RepID=UPI0006F51B10|nr:TraB/VirB10 family protein [Rhizobacter sp. Root1221]KQW02862.1 conjugal transfer protein TraB [Rhizobacter sp. Root1221]